MLAAAMQIILLNNDIYHKPELCDRNVFVFPSAPHGPEHDLHLSSKPNLINSLLRLWIQCYALKWLGGQTAGLFYTDCGPENRCAT